MTATIGLDDSSDISLTATGEVTVAQVDAYPINSIWVTPDSVRAQPRIYNATA